MLVLTAELGEAHEDVSMLKYFVIEIGALTVLILVLVAERVASGTSVPVNIVGFFSVACDS